MLLNTFAERSAISTDENIMTIKTAKVRAADHLIDQLVAQGSNLIFGVPGESYLPVLDALHGREREIRFVTCRQEGGAAMAADAYAKLTGRPGICFVTRGPGATNASAGVHVAHQDSTPLILFIGQVARGMTEREAFQEIDYRRMFSQMTKWVAEIDDASRIQEFISRAYRVAISGRPGPVVLSLPEDMLYDMVQAPTSPKRISTPRYAPATPVMQRLQDRISQAQKPLIMAGGGGWTVAGIDALRRFAENQSLPVAVSFRSQSLMNNDHPNYVGHFSTGHTPYLKKALVDTDLLIAIGPRLGEITTAGYNLLRPPVDDIAIAHVFPDPNELGRVYTSELNLASDTESFCLEVANWAPLRPERFGDRTASLRAEYEVFNDPQSVPDDPLAPYFSYLNNILPHNAIFANGAGNYAVWLHRFLRYRSQGSQLAPTSGSMGYGLPGAIAAALTVSDREVFAFAGDGCFMMTCQEMATAAHHNLNLTVFVINNMRFGTIRAHQEREYPARVSGTALTNPDFCKFAASFGAATWRVSTLEQFKSAMREARDKTGLKLVEVLQDQRFLVPGKTLPV